MVDCIQPRQCVKGNKKTKGITHKKDVLEKKKLVWKPERVTGKTKEMSYPITHPSVVSYWGLACELWIEMH